MPLPVRLGFMDSVGVASFKRFEKPEERDGGCLAVWQQPHSFMQFPLFCADEQP